MKRNAKKALTVAILAGAAVGVGLWWRSAHGDKGHNPAPATAQVVRRSFASTVMATGAVKPQVGAEVRVGARASGRVERLYANIGDPVEKGDVIAELEKADLEATVAQRQAELQMAEAKLSAARTLGPREIENAKADVTKWQATVVLTRKELARQEDLVEQRIGSREDLDRAQERLSVAEAQLAGAQGVHELAEARHTEDLKQADADVERAKAALANAEVQLSYATITAPISGVIASVSTQEGETVAAGLNAPTFVTIIDLKRLQVDAYVDEVDIGKITVAQRVMFTVDAFPAREFEGKVTAIYPDAVIQDNVVNYDVVIEITPPYEGVLRPEMTTSVTILLEKRTDVLAVPARAVKRERGKTVVYALVNEQPERREVKVGWKDDEWIEVVAGLEEGQSVFVEAPSAKSTEP